jgi:hypothetical protein
MILKAKEIEEEQNCFMPAKVLSKQLPNIVCYDSLLSTIRFTQAISRNWKQCLNYT